MKTSCGIGLLLAVLVWGCGSNKTSSAPKTNPDAAASTADDVGARSDLPANPGGDISPPSSPLGDAASVGGNDASVPDVTSAANPDAILPTQPEPSRDAAVATEPQILPPPIDGAPLLPGTTLVASSTTPDDNTEPATCSTVVLGTQTFSADKSYDIVMPDCRRVSGTVTLAGPLPSGAVYASGAVNAFKIIRDADGRVSDTVSYAASITPVDDTHYRYTMSLPADTYEMQYNFTVKSDARLPSTAVRFAQDRLVVPDSAIKHDVTLPAIDVVTRTATITGTDALASNGSAFGRFIQLMLLNSTHTLLVSGISMTGGPSVAISMWVPRETVKPTLMVQESPVSFAPYASGYASQFQLDAITPTGDFTLAQPAAAKISGTIADPTRALSPMISVGSSGTSAVSYYHCNTQDTGTFPNPIFFYPEGSVSSYFSAATSHFFYVRKGLRCVDYAHYAIATGSPGALPTRAGENTYAFMQDPTPKVTNAITVDADLTRNINVPALGPQVTITGTVKDARGKAVAGAELSVVSRSLSTAAVADKNFVGGLDVSASGEYTLHVLPGTYYVKVALPKDATTVPTTPDAGVSTKRDAAPDSRFTWPDLGAGGDCATLAPCCSTLSGSNKTMCDYAVASGVDSSCSSILSLLRLGGSCS